MAAIGLNDEIAKFLDRGTYAGAGHAFMAGVGLITAGAGSVVQMILTGKSIADMKKSLEANTASIGSLKEAVDANTSETKAMREDIGKLAAGVERMAATLEKISGKLDRLGGGGGGHDGGG